MASIYRTRDAELSGAIDTSPEMNALITEMLDSISARAINSDPDASDILGIWEKQMTNKAPVDGSDVLGAFISGGYAGSIAVARQWVKADPRSAIVYYANRKPQANRWELPSKRRPT